MPETGFVVNCKRRGLPPIVARCHGGGMKGPNHGQLALTAEPPFVAVAAAELPDVAFADTANREFPHHFTGPDGQLYVHRGALAAAWAMANGAGVPRAAQPIRDHLRGHLAKLGMSAALAEPAVAADQAETHLTRGTLDMAPAMACIRSAGPSVQAVAHDDTDGTNGRFQMEVYTGAVFKGHWYWGDVVLDLDGFQPKRLDVPAQVDHRGDMVAGHTENLWTDSGSIFAAGPFLNGDKEETAALISGRLSQGFPYQSSGEWQPIAVEQILEGATAVVNGQTHDGPVTIFREFDLAECSFVTRGWDSMTNAVAAKRPADHAGIITIHTKEQTMTTPAKTKDSPTTPAAVLAILGALSKVFDPERALAMVTANPAATGLDDFTTDLVSEIEQLRTQAADLETQHAETVQTLTAEVADLKAKATAAVATAAAPAPVVIVRPDDPTHTAAAADTTDQDHADILAKYEAMKSGSERRKYGKENREAIRAATIQRDRREFAAA